MTEGIHFTWGLSTPYQVGFKLISINVSDVYAMMADPAFALLSLTLPPDMDRQDAWRMLDGVADALEAYGATLVGGNVTSSLSGATVTATLLGYAETPPLRRSGAITGQKIFVTGPLGDSACGLLIMKKTGRPVALELGETPDSAPELKPVDSVDMAAENRGAESRVSAKHKPWNLVPGGWEAVLPLVRRHLMPVVKKPSPGRYGAMMDVSDGLLMDLKRLCEASGVGARLYEERLPVSPVMRAAAQALGEDPVELCLSGGEDYEYLYTSDADADDGNSGALCIGEIVPEGFKIFDVNANLKEWPRGGYEHFKV
jgi:thiamine-monophosphate kinase